MMLKCQKYEKRPLELSPLLTLEIPQGMRQSNSLPIFKKQIRSWNGAKCSFRLCKVFIPKVGFLTGYIFQHFCPVIFNTSFIVNNVYCK